MQREVCALNIFETLVDRGAGAQISNQYFVKKGQQQTKLLAFHSDNKNQEFHERKIKLDESITNINRK